MLNNFDSYIKYSNFIGVNHATLSSWKLKKARIPLKVLKQICLSLDLPYSQALQNVTETDREIAEII